MTNETNETNEGSLMEEGEGAGDTRALLLNAAIEVFLEKGYGRTRVQDIAHRAGFTAGALYVHFPGRAALLNEALLLEGKAALEELVERFRVVVEEGPAGWLSFAALGDGDPSRFDILLVEALAVAAREDEARATLSGVLDDLTGLIDRRLFEAKKNGEFPTDINEESLRHLLLAVIFGSMLTKNLGYPNGGAESTAGLLANMAGGLSAAT